jgi:hypothetical protein
VSTDPLSTPDGDAGSRDTELTARHERPGDGVAEQADAVAPDLMAAIAAPMQAFAEELRLQVPRPLPMCPASRFSAHSLVES